MEVGLMIEWNDYIPFDPGVRGLLDELPRRDARAHYERLMSEKESRIAELQKLLASNDIELSRTDEGIQRLNDWFREHVEPDTDQPGRLRNLWYAIVNDIALFLGDVVIDRAPNLHWDFFTWGKKDAAYQRHVIMGFSRVPNQKFNIDIDRAVAIYGQRIVAGEKVERDAFHQWIAYALENA
jgi:hypothetical protein